MRHVTGATPLFALNAVAIDLETTSLDVKDARIVQIGALHIEGGEIDAGHPFDRLVDPLVPIPPAVSAVHGVTDDIVKGAENLATRWAEFNRFIAGRVLIGHTLAYDLTVLRNEAHRHRLSWHKPRSLCIRLLAPLVVPALHDPSLEKLAAWFHIDIENRHTALGDARAAGQIFLRMVPLLIERGIHSLAQAERALAHRTPQPAAGAVAGWDHPIADPRSGDVGGDFKTYDTYVYRHMIGDVMSAPPVVIAKETKLSDAMAAMMEKAISSVLVADRPEPGQPISAYGILTERDVLRHIAKGGADALTHPVATIASAPVTAIREGTFVYRAIPRMRRQRYRHLAVINDSGELTGIVSARDLLKLRTDPAIMLNDEIEEAGSASDMAFAWSNLATVVQSLTREGLDAHIITRIVSEELRAATERAAGLAEESMRADGFADPPCAYAIMVLGSGGRGESLLKPDQDNAVIFEHGDAGGREDKWFAELGTRMASILDTAGIPLCDGGVMARNPSWRGSLATWRARVDAWIASGNPQNLLNVDIFFDGYPVHGRRQLATDLFTYAYAMGSRSPIFTKLLGAKLEQIANPFGFFGRINTENGKIDLKLHALFPVVAAARTLAIRHNILAHSTKDRLSRLAALERGDAALLLGLLDDHAFCQSLLLAQQSRAMLGGEKLSNAIDIAKLSAREAARLKEALKRIQLVPDLVRGMMF
ncbi:DUF294 nucleotidyltransferase-like domain-containing protein [Dongia sp.]|uniref:DUF294 nucleotidyltransferase-like domain-containing protein n=1 Tax=Dongia sp. TaxID=1977262 RepID=UPI0035B11969